MSQNSNDTSLFEDDEDVEEGAVTTKGVAHYLTEEDFEENKELEDEGLEVGDLVFLPETNPEQEEDKEELPEALEEEYESSIPAWARAEGIKPSKEDEAAFSTAAQPSKVVRKENEELPSYMQS